MIGRWSRKRHLVTTLVLLVIILLRSIFSDVFQVIFAVPAGVITATFFGTDFSILPGNIVQIYGSSFTVNVTSACSAVFFFALIFSILFGLFFERKRKWLLWLPFFAIMITIFVNVLRLILVIYCGALFEGILDPYWQLKLHLVLGIFVFLPSLMLISSVFERICSDER
jgi:exosortase/archaeosortase family protein